MAARYAFHPGAAQDVKQLLRAQRQKEILALIVEDIPAVLADPPRAGEPKTGALRGCYARRLSQSGAAYRLAYTVRDDAVLFLAVGAHDAAYRDAEGRV